MSNEILMLRQDTLCHLGGMAASHVRSMPQLFGVQLQVVPDHMNDILTTKHYSVEKVPGKKRRRKGYRVKSEKRPCAFVINKAALGLGSPFDWRINF